MYNWIETIDPATIPHLVLNSERARRAARRVQHRPGKAPLWVACIYCRQMYTREEFGLHKRKKCYPELLRKVAP